MVRANCLLLVPGDAHLSDTMCASDFLAFSFILFFTRRSKVPELKVKTILDIIAEDATKYFLVIFTSHFVFVMTLNLGRVSENILLLSMTLTGRFFRQRLSFFRARKLSPISPENKNSNHTFSPIQSAASSCMPSPHHLHLKQSLTFCLSYLPVMISRIMLSLKKAGRSPQSNWALVDRPSTYPDPRDASGFSDSRRMSKAKGGDVPLDTYRVLYQ